MGASALKITPMHPFLRLGSFVEIDAIDQEVGSGEFGSLR